MASQGQVFSVAGGNVKEVVANEPDAKLEQKAAPKKKKKKKVVHKSGWWDEVVTSKAAWSVAMAAALIGIAVIGRCWRHERDQNQQLRLQLSAKEEVSVSLSLSSSLVPPSISFSRFLKISFFLYMNHFWSFLLISRGKSKFFHMDPMDVSELFRPRSSEIL
jgi:hypothetical protein